MPTKTIARDYATLSGEERFRLAIEAMARGDTVEERRLDESCPMLVYKCEDEAYRGRMRRLYAMAVNVAMEIRERMVVLRAAAAFETHGRAMVEIAFRPLVQAAFLAGRDVGRWEAGEKAEDTGVAIVPGPDVRRDLAEIAACTAECTDRIVSALKEAAAEQHATAVLTRWEAFGQFCRERAGLEPMTVMRAWGLMAFDPAETVREAHTQAEPDQNELSYQRDAMSFCWGRGLRFSDP